MIVLIVDDGQYIVEYLKHLLDWSKFGVEQVMTTTNSIKAKEILLQSAIDILITDIRMPEVSGINLLEFVGTMKMKTKVIFLSGYSEFEYAQKAIRLGLFDYLLKPVDKEDMEKVMRDVIKSIEDSRIEAGTLWNSADGLNYLISAISGNESLIQICTPLQQRSCEHRKMRFFKCTLADELNEINLQDTLRNLDAFVWIFPPSAFGMISESGAEKLKAALSSIDLSESFYLKNKQVVRQIFYQFLYCEEVAPADFHFLQNAEEFSKLELGEWECARKRIQNRYPQWTSRKHKIIYLLEVANYLYISTDKVHSEQFLDWLINRLRKPIEVYESIIFAISRLCQEKEMPVENIVETIRTYISGHLDEALSLEELGQIVHLHPVYLSKFYKQNTGENLSGYITMKRLERAARLLIESNLHVVDIARMVGYRKAQYFIKLFKDLYGVTPQIYRQNHTKQRLNFMK